MICLRAFFNYVEDEHHVSLNPFHTLRIELKLKKQLPEVLNLDEVKLLLGAPRIILEEILMNKHSGLTSGSIKSYKQFKLLGDVLILEILLQLRSE